MKRPLVVLIMVGYIFSLAAQQNTPYIKDIDGDQVADTFYLETPLQKIVCKLSSQNFLKVESKELTWRDNLIQLSSPGTNNNFTLEYSCRKENNSSTGNSTTFMSHFGYDSSNKQIQLIGMSRIVKGEDEYSGKGEDHVNLITGNYIGEWEYFDFEKETIVKIPKITSKMTFEKVYLQDYDYKQNRLFLTKSNIQYKKVLRKLNYQNDTLAILTDFLSDRTGYYSIFYWKSGDINNDKNKDFIVVLQSNNYRDDEYGSYDRKVLLIENIGYPELKLSAENNYIVDCSNCGGGGVGDPLQGITIKNNYFSFEQLYGAATKCLVVTTFKYNQSSKEWMLHKVGEECYGLNQNSLEVETDLKVKTIKDFGQVKFEDYRPQLLF